MVRPRLWNVLSGGVTFKLLVQLIHLISISEQLGLRRGKFS